MAPKEKAKELFTKMDTAANGSDYSAKQCALIAVDEVVKELQETEFNYEIETLPFQYWQEVKNEIEKL